MYWILAEQEMIFLWKSKNYSILSFFSSVHYLNGLFGSNKKLFEAKSLRTDMISMDEFAAFLGRDKVTMPRLFYECIGRSANHKHPINWMPS